MKFCSVLFVASLLFACSEPDPKVGNANNVNNGSCTSNDDCLATEVCNQLSQCVPGTQCALDADCTADRVCERQGCVSTCTTDADCAAGEICGSRDFGEGLVCGLAVSNNINNTNNNTNNTNNNNGGGTYAFFLVEDTTVGFGCEVSDPGSDLQYVRITDLGGAPVGYATLRDVEFGPETNDFIDTGILDGNPPDFAGQCTDDFADTSVVSTGCGGRFLLQALDGTATPFEIMSGTHLIEVGEYGTTCDGSADDAFQVFGCTDGDGALATTTCDVLFGSGEGITIFDVAE